MKLLPIHPQPKKGEILSSWMARLSFANSYQLHTFYSSVLKYKDQIWTRDVDRNPSVDLITLLSDSAGCPPSNLNSLTLGLYDGFLYEDVRRNGIAKWVLPLGVFHRTHRRKGIQCCPLCLAEGEPYYRLMWRISLFTFCERHNCFLINECPECHSNIEYHRLGIGGNDFVNNLHLSRCAKCAFDLSTSEVIYPQHTSPRIFSDYRKLLVMISENKWGRIAHLPVTHPLSFFEGFRALLSFINKRSATKMRTILNDKFHIDLSIQTVGWQEFNYLPINERFKLVMTALWLLREWPDRFVSILHKSSMSRSRFAEVVDDLPYWLVDALNLHVDQRVYIPTAEEVDTIKKYLERNNIQVSAKSLAQHLGIGNEWARSLLRSSLE